MKWATLLMMVLILVGCAETQTVEPHGNEVADEPNMAGVDGPYDVISQQVRYYEEVMGYEAMPSEEGDHPGVVMIHEWWGLNDNIRSMADRLASHGYRVLAVDLYNGQVASTPEEARSLVQNFDMAEGLENMQAAVSYLEENSNGKVASLGWCFGGGQSFSLAKESSLDAAVIYYGQVSGGVSGVNEPVLGIFAGEDESISVSSVEAFEEQLNTEGVENNVIIYPGVRHAFANPSGDRYSEEEAEDAWAKTLAFLEEELKSESTVETEVNVEVNPSEPSSDSGPDAVFELEGYNYHFEMDGERNPVLRVQEGDLVRIEFSSEQGFHDWVLDEFNAATARVMDADGMVAVEFIADTAGEYEYYCSVGSHRANGMRGRLVVE